MLDQTELAVLPSKIHLFFLKYSFNIITNFPSQEDLPLLRDQTQVYYIAGGLLDCRQILYQLNHQEGPNNYSNIYLFGCVGSFLKIN